VAPSKIIGWHSETYPTSWIQPTLGLTIPTGATQFAPTPGQVTYGPGWRLVT
jgi:hypothetical protein